MSKGVLVDITNCVGCGSCAVACKMWNNQGYTKDDPNQGTNATLNDENWTTISHEKVDLNGKEVWRFVKHQCMHCIDPACASVCMSKAIYKSEDGPVIYDPRLCVGCRYCMLACPFEIPKYEWEKTLPSIAKCQMCDTKIAKGERPACATVCPTDALIYGDRDELLKIATDKISKDSKYVKHIYGEKEAGGTEWLYISDVPFDDLGLNTKMTHQPLPHYTDEFIKFTPAIFLGGGLLFTALSFYTKRRQEVALAEQDEKQGGKK